MNKVLVSVVCLIAGLSAAVVSATPTPTPIPTPYFTDVSAEVGLVDISAFRIGIADVNGDGYPDILIHKACDEGTGDVLNKHFLYLNVPGANPADRQFVDFTEESGIQANRQGTTDGRHSSSAIFVDVDNDGDADLFNIVYVHRNYTLNLGTNDLMLNDGEGHFTFAPNSPFHLEIIHNTATACFLDFNNDGFLDVFTGNWYLNEALSQDHLYQGLGDGSFTRVTETCGLNGFKTALYGSAAFDWNDDGFMDLFLPSYSHTAPAAKYYHWKNNGDGTFTDVTEETGYGAYGGYESGFASFGSMPGDYDNDGDLDFLELLVHGNMKVYSTTVTNMQYAWSWDFDRVVDRPTEDPRPRHHGDHHAHWFDIENDGLADFILSESGYDNNRLYIFKQHADNTFHPITPDTGLNIINDNNLPPGNVSPFDYDLDGDDDLLVGFGSQDGMQLWRNDVGTMNHWVTVTLQGVGKEGFSNRDAVGARVKVTAGGITHTREVYAGHGHQCPQIPLSLSFGLGQATQIESIEVRWLNENLTHVAMYDLPVDQFLTIREDPSPNPPEIGVRLAMPGSVFHPGDTCWLDAYLYNNGPQDLNDAILVVALEVYGTFFFYSSWGEALDGVLVDVPLGSRYYPIIPAFEWPETGSDVVTGLVFYAGLLDMTMNLLGDLDGLGQWTFGYSP